MSDCFSFSRFGKQLMKAIRDDTALRLASQRREAGDKRGREARIRIAQQENGRVIDVN